MTDCASINGPVDVRFTYKCLKWHTSERRYSTLYPGFARVVSVQMISAEVIHIFHKRYIGRGNRPEMHDGSVLAAKNSSLNVWPALY